MHAEGIEGKGTVLFKEIGSKPGTNQFGNYGNSSQYGPGYCRRKHT